MVRAGIRLAALAGRPELYGPTEIDGHAVPPGEAFPGPGCTGPMAELLRAHAGRLVHKWEHYLGIYDRYLAPFRAGFVAPEGMRPLRLLEIGVFQGGSLELWRGYFGPQAVIFGVDIDPRCAAFDGPAARVRIGSQTDAGFLRAVVAEMGGVDVVIDDGSHVARHQRASLETLFPLLPQGGLYMVEDTHTAYFPGWHEGGYRRSGSFIEFTKALIDDLHGQWHGRAPAAPWAVGGLTGLHVHDSVVVLDRATKPPLRHGMVGTPGI